MPTGNVQIEEFREFVLNDYGSQVAEEFSKELGACGSSTLYSHAMNALDAVLARHTVPTYFGPTTSRGDINLVI